MMYNYHNNKFQDSQDRIGSQQTLSDFLSKPFQRIMKYPLLLKEMAKNATDIQEKALIQATALQIGSKIDDINKTKAASDSRKAMSKFVAEVEGVSV